VKKQLLYAEVAELVARHEKHEKHEKHMLFKCDSPQSLHFCVYKCQL
jgi:hypothetical protein